jgi:teichuronic acid biosynthesis glycosyltransferase TuaC
MKVAAPIRTLLFSTLYPSSVRPGHGIFVETRLRELLTSGEVQTRVIAPVAWFFSSHPYFGDRAQMARTPRRETHNGIDVQHPRYLLAPKVGMTSAPWALALGALPAVQRLLNEGFDFDVIDAHYYYPDGVAAALLARYFKKPFTVTARGSDINLIAHYALPRRMMRWAAGQAHASIGVSQALIQEMALMGMPTSKLMAMPNGVDSVRFHVQCQAEVRRALDWPEVPTLISVGNLVENKGHHIAIEALLDLPDFHLVVVGDGPERQSLAALTRRLQLASRVRFTGRLDQATLTHWYNAADILLLPSSREGWPNVLLESMACGTPVVATKVGGVSEIMGSACAGRLMASRTAAAAAAAVGDLWHKLPRRDAVRQLALARSWHSTNQAQIDLFRRVTAQGYGATQGESRC